MIRRSDHRMVCLDVSPKGHSGGDSTNDLVGIRHGLRHGLESPIIDAMETYPVHLVECDRTLEPFVFLSVEVLKCLSDSFGFHMRCSHI